MTINKPRDAVRNPMDEVAPIAEPPMTLDKFAGILRSIIKQTVNLDQDKVAEVLYQLFEEVQENLHRSRMATAATQQTTIKQPSYEGVYEDVGKSPPQHVPVDSSDDANDALA